MGRSSARTQSGGSSTAGKEQTRPRVPTPEQRAAIGLLSHDLDRVWSATTTTDQDRKELLHALLEEVIIALDRANYNAHLTVRWRAGLFSEIDVALPRSHPAAIRTTDDTIALLRRLLSRL
jgi:hypothetical protein